MNYDNDEDSLEFINRLLERLHDLEDDRNKELKNERNIVINIYRPGSQQVGRIVNQYVGTADRDQKSENWLPSPNQMARAVEKTMAEGCWWAGTAWAVVYRIYQMRGYGGSISQFVREVEEWPFERRLDYGCTYDAVCKPVRGGSLAGGPDEWSRDGCMRQQAILGKRLLEELACSGQEFQ